MSFAKLVVKNTLPVVILLHPEIKTITSIENVIFIFPKFDSKLARANLRANSVC